MEKVFYKSRLVNTVLEVRNTNTLFDKTLKPYTVILYVEYIDGYADSEETETVLENDFDTLEEAKKAFDEIDAVLQKYTKVKEGKTTFELMEESRKEWEEKKKKEVR